MRFENKVAVVTGGSQGIGRAATVAFAKEGASVVNLSIDDERGESLSKELESAGYTTMFISADVSDEGAVRSAIDKVIDTYGQIDVLVNNAGIYLQGDVASTSLTDWERIMAVNLTGTYLCTHYVVPKMQARGTGVIVNVASEAGLVGIGGQVAYNVSKAGMIAFTKSCAVDLAQAGIRVNCVCPGTTETPLVQAAISQAKDPNATRRQLESSRPMDRLGTPDEIASAILYLADDAAAYATGAVLSIDGGYTAQ